MKIVQRQFCSSAENPSLQGRTEQSRLRKMGWGTFLMAFSEFHGAVIAETVRIITHGAILV
jgi:hypothetical protein